MKTIYAIATGEYSDYCIRAVSDDKAAAEEWVNALVSEDGGWHTDARIEELIFIEKGVSPTKEHYVDLSQDLWNDGAEGELRINERDEYPIASYNGAPPERPRVRFVRAPCHRGSGGRIEIRGNNTQAVMKVYSEQKAMWKASPVSFKEIG